MWKFQEIEYPPDKWKIVSLSAKELTSQMLAINPLERYSASSILQHPWMLKNNHNQTSPRIISPIIGRSTSNDETDENIINQLSSVSEIVNNNNLEDDK